MENTENQPTTPAPEDQQPADPPQAVQPPTQEKKSNQGLVIGLVFFALAALGIAGVLAFQNHQLKQKAAPKKATSLPSPPTTLAPSPVATVVATVTVSPTPMIDPMANWLTLPNKDICYTFKYSKNITYQERKEENIIHLSLWGPSQEKDTEFYDGISLSFSMSLQIGNTTLKDYVDQKIAESKQFGEILKPRSEITINGIKGYTYTSEGLGIFQNIYLQSPDKACTVEIVNATYDPTNQGYQQTVDQIFSTFKFTK